MNFQAVTKTMFWYILYSHAKRDFPKTRKYQIEYFQYFYDVSDAVDLNSKCDQFKIKLLSKRVSLYNQAKR